MHGKRPKLLIKHAVANKPNRLILDLVNTEAFWPAPLKCADQHTLASHQDRQSLLPIILDETFVLTSNWYPLGMGASWRRFW